MAHAAIGRAATLSLLVAAAIGHLAFYEGQRNRHNNFQPTGGYADPSASTDDDWTFEHPADHLTLTALRGKARPSVDSVFESTLVGRGDYDVVRWTKLDDGVPAPMFFHSHVPACQELEGLFPAFAFVGPLNATDHLTGKKMFREPRPEDRLPFKVPVGYGVEMMPEAARQRPRVLYYSKHALIAWLEPHNWDPACCDDLNMSDARCVAMAGSVIHHTILQPGKYYAVVWSEDDAFELPVDEERIKRYVAGEDVALSGRRILDVGIVFGGKKSAFMPDDMAILIVQQKFTAHGRGFHATCSPLKSY